MNRTHTSQKKHKNTKLENDAFKELGNAQVRLFGGMVLLSWALIALVLIYSQID